MKLTGWYSGRQRPARMGMYERSYFEEVYYCHWNGKRWGIGFDDSDRDWASPVDSCHRWTSIPFTAHLS